MLQWNRRLITIVAALVLIALAGLNGWGDFGTNTNWGW